MFCLDVLSDCLQVLLALKSPTRWCWACVRFINASCLTVVQLGRRRSCALCSPLPFRTKMQLFALRGLFQVLLSFLPPKLLCLLQIISGTSRLWTISRAVLAVSNLVSKERCFLLVFRPPSSSTSNGPNPLLLTYFVYIQ